MSGKFQKVVILGIAVTFILSTILGFLASSFQ